MVHVVACFMGDAAWYGDGANLVPVEFANSLRGEYTGVLLGGILVGHLKEPGS